jgi:phosphatidylglycerophosphatase A
MKDASGSIAPGFWHPAHLIATVGGIGHLRPAPGTWGSLAALPIAWFAWQVGGAALLLAAAAAAFVLGLWASAVMVHNSANKDPGFIVIDEVAGQLLAALPIALWSGRSVGPEPLVALALAFGLFRALDIAKPWPIGWIDRRAPGAWGVMLDDIAAGLIAALLLAAILATGVIA